MHIIVIDGVIGCGKTTSLKVLQKGFESDGWTVYIVKEPVDKWKKSGRLALFYEDMQRRSYQFQTRTFRDRVREMQNVWKDLDASNDKIVVLMERSIFSGKIFVDILVEQNLMDPSEAEDYTELWNMWPSLLPAIPDIFIYLRPDLDVVMQRLRDRNRSEEAAVSIQYQRCLLEYHDEYYSDGTQNLNGKECPMIVLETNFNYKDSEDGQKRLYEMVLEAINYKYKNEV